MKIQRLSKLEGASNGSSKQAINSPKINQRLKIVSSKFTNQLGQARTYESTKKYSRTKAQKNASHQFSPGSGSQFDATRIKFNNSSQGRSSADLDSILNGDIQTTPDGKVSIAPFNACI